MRKSIISLMFLCCWAGSLQAATTSDLAEGAPDRYVVVKGDTLWGIAGRFLNSPWKWGELWKSNQEQIKNPNRIYPGDVIVLDKSAADLRLRLLKNGTVKLSPQILQSALEPEPIATIPTSDIEPFLSKPLVVAESQLAAAARIVRTQESRVAIGAGNTAYARGLSKEQGEFLQIFRPGAMLTDPDTKEPLGREAIYLGEARVQKYGEVSTIEILKSPVEIYAGDYLLPAPREVLLDSYVPHAPNKKIDARVIAAYGGLFEVGNNAIVTINKGTRDGLEAGHVLAIFRNLNASTNSLRESALYGRRGLIYDEKNPQTSYVNRPLGNRDSPVWGRFGPNAAKYVNDNSTLPTTNLPDERYGLMLIFRVFDRASYALVMNASRPVNILDKATNP